MSTQIDHQTSGIAKLLTQYRETLNLIGYLNAVLTEADTLEEVYQDLLLTRAIDEASDTTLDIIGSIVGQSRFIEALDDILAFGFLGSTNSGTFGTLAVPATGAEWLSLFGGSSGVILSDEDYRVYIRARIARNHSKGTINDIIQAVLFVATGATSVVIVEGVAAFTLEIIGPVDPNTESILLNSGILPKPAGVTLTSLTFTP